MKLVAGVISLLFSVVVYPTAVTSFPSLGVAIIVRLAPTTTGTGVVPVISEFPFITFTVPPVIEEEILTLRVARANSAEISVSPVGVNCAVTFDSDPAWLLLGVGEAGLTHFTNLYPASGVAEISTFSLCLLVVPIYLLSAVAPEIETNPPVVCLTVRTSTIFASTVIVAARLL